jgi:hypothetical protein
MIAVVTEAISLTENRAGKGSHRLASCGATCSLVPSVSSDSQHEPKPIPAAIIVRFVDAYAIHKQTNEKCNRSNDSVPQPAPKSGRSHPVLCTWSLAERLRENLPWGRIIDAEKPGRDCHDMQQRTHPENGCSNRALTLRTPQCYRGLFDNGVVGAGQVPSPDGLTQSACLEELSIALRSLRQVPATDCQPRL